MKQIAMKKKIKTILILLLISQFSSCIFPDTLGQDTLKFHFTWEDKSIYSQPHLTINNDTLTIQKIGIVITDLKLISPTDTIHILDSKVIKTTDSSIDLIDVPASTYQISFNFGIKEIDKNYHRLKAENYSIGNGYYFLKIEGTNTSTNKEFKYHTAKQDSSQSELKSFHVNIDGFRTGTSIFYNYANININLKNLFTTPNLIQIDKLKDAIIDNTEEQVKMIENAKNIFYLDSYTND